MIINQNPKFGHADVYPWANSTEEARRQKRITVTIEGLVQYDSRYWTEQEFIEYISTLSRGFAEAFTLAVEAKARSEAHKKKVRTLLAAMETQKGSMAKNDPKFCGLESGTNET